MGRVKEIQTKYKAHVWSPSPVWLFATPWTPAQQASLSLTISWNLPKFMFIALVTFSNHLTSDTLFFFFLQFSHYQGLFQWVSCSHQVTKILQFQHSSEHSELISLKIDWFDLPPVQGTFRSLLEHHSSNASILWHSAFFTVQLSRPYMTTGKTINSVRFSCLVVPNSL